MGYQLVKVILKNEKVLSRHKVINATFLLLDEQETFDLADIDRLLPEKAR